MKKTSSKSTIIGYSSFIFSIILMVFLIPRGIYVPQNSFFLQSPAFFPTVLSILVGLLGLVILVFNENPSDEEYKSQLSIIDAFLMILLLLFYYITIQAIGMLLASIVTIYIFMRMFGARGNLKIASVALLMPIFLFCFFESVDVDFPLGTVTEWAMQRLDVG